MPGVMPIMDGSWYEVCSHQPYRSSAIMNQVPKIQRQYVMLIRFVQGLQQETVIGTDRDWEVSAQGRARDRSTIRTKLVERMCYLILM